MLPDQPATTEVARLAVRVTKDAARQIRGGHPWVFDSSVTAVRPTGRVGDLAVVFDERRDFMAIGLFDPDSPIRVRILHQGRPTPIDRTFWRQRLASALQRRATLVHDPATTAYRWVHGENDGLPGLVLDRYDTTVVAKVYSAAWFPHLPQVVESIVDVATPETVVLRLARNTGGDNVPAGLPAYRDGQALLGRHPEGPVHFLENGLTFEADLVHGQKTGHFLDQRNNRERVRGLSSGARVLDVYACTGGFSVNAAAGGAQLVHRVDISAEALATARRNMEHNRALPAVRDCRQEDTVGDAMATMAELADRGRRFDVVVVDPPSFASRQDQVDRALRAYTRLTQLALRLLEPGGRLVQASCSARVGAEDLDGAVEAAAAGSGYRLSEVTRTGHAIDHPVGFPQGAYLTAVFATVQRGA